MAESTPNSTPHQPTQTERDHRLAEAIRAFETQIAANASRDTLLDCQRVVYAAAVDRRRSRIARKLAAAVPSERRAILEAEVEDTSKIDEYERSRRTRGTFSPRAIAASAESAIANLELRQFNSSEITRDEIARGIYDQSASDEALYERFVQTISGIRRNHVVADFLRSRGILTDSLLRELCAHEEGRGARQSHEQQEQTHELQGIWRFLIQADMDVAKLLVERGILTTASLRSINALDDFIPGSMRTLDLVFLGQSLESFRFLIDRKTLTPLTLASVLRTLGPMLGAVTYREWEEWEQTGFWSAHHYNPLTGGFNVPDVGVLVDVLRRGVFWRSYEKRSAKACWGGIDHLPHPLLLAMGAPLERMPAYDAALQKAKANGALRDGMSLSDQIHALVRSALDASPTYQLLIDTGSYTAPETARTNAMAVCAHQKQELARSPQSLEKLGLSVEQLLQLDTPSHFHAYLYARWRRLHEYMDRMAVGIYASVLLTLMDEARLSLFDRIALVPRLGAGAMVNPESPLHDPVLVRGLASQRISTAKVSGPAFLRLPLSGRMFYLTHSTIEADSTSASAVVGYASLRNPRKMQSCRTTPIIALRTEHDRDDETYQDEASRNVPQYADRVVETWSSVDAMVDEFVLSTILLEAVEMERAGISLPHSHQILRDAHRDLVLTSDSYAAMLAER